MKRISRFFSKIGTVLNQLERNEISNLDLSGKDISDKEIIKIANALKKTTSVKVLNLSENEIGNEGATALAKALENNTSVKELDLPYNEIGNEGATAIAKVLEDNNTLETLNLYQNKIGDKGAAALAKALEENNTLEILNLYGNDIGDAGVAALAKALEVNTGLTSLEMTDNKQITDKGWADFAKGLADNNTLEILYLGYNNIGNAGAAALAKGLETNIALESIIINSKLSLVEFRDGKTTSLNLSRKGYGNQEAIIIGALLQGNKSLTSLDISDNKISTLPPAMLPALRRLKEFECSGNPWTNPPMEVMTQGLEAIIKFMSRLEAEGKETCNLAMLAILGKGEVGKTSLLRALLAPSNRTDAIAKEDRTIGLDLVRWEVKETLPSSELTLNVQDFAGQEIYYATHQLFLSKRAAYLLVWDASRDDVEAQLEPWLGSLQANMPGALVLLVATHAAPELVSQATLQARVARAQQCCRQLLERHRAALQRKIKQLQQRAKSSSEKFDGQARGGFPGSAHGHGHSQLQRLASNISSSRSSSSGQQATLLQVVQGAESFCVDSLAAKGVENLREKLAEAVQQLPQVGVDIPKSFAEVLKRIQSMRDKLVSSNESQLLPWKDFCQHIARNSNIRGEQDEVKLDDQTLTDAVQFWSDLGEVYYRDDFVVLSPSYIVDSIKELVRHNRPDPRDPALRSSFHRLKAQGILDQQLLQRVLWEGFDRFTQEKLLVALEQFKVLHRLEQGQKVQARTSLLSAGGGAGSVAVPVGTSWMCPCLVGNTPAEPRLLAGLAGAFQCDYFIPLLPADLFPCLLVELFREDRGYFLPQIARRWALLTCRERNAGRSGQCFISVSKPSHRELIEAQHSPGAEPHFVPREECVFKVRISATDRGLFEFVESKLRDRLQQYYMVTYPLRPCPSCQPSEAFRFNMDELPLDRPKLAVMCPHCRRSTQVRELVLSQASQVFISYNWGVYDRKDKKYDNQEKVKELKSAIETHKQLTCWMDLNEMEAGDSLEQKMKDGIAFASVVLVVLSPAYVCSVNCMREYKWAQEMGKKVIVVVTHPYATARARKKWGVAESDKREGGLREALNDEQKRSLEKITGTELYFDFTTGDKWSQSLPEFLLKLQEEADSAVGHQTPPASASAGGGPLAFPSPRSRSISSAFAPAPAAAAAATPSAALEELWLELCKDIPGAEDDGMTLRDFQAMTKEDLEEGLEDVNPFKRGKLRRLHAELQPK